MMLRPGGRGLLSTVRTCPFEVVWAWNLEILVCWGGVGTLLSFEGSGDWLLVCLLVSQGCRMVVLGAWWAGCL